MTNPEPVAVREPLARTPPQAPVSVPLRAPMQRGNGANRGPLGERNSVGLQLLLACVTFGLYGYYWAYKSHEEIKRHSGEGVGGVVGVLLYLFAGVITLFLLPLEIKRMYEREGLHSPVSAATAFWSVLFVVPWYVRCQTAMNQYWALKGAPPA